MPYKEAIARRNARNHDNTRTSVFFSLGHFLGQIIGNAPTTTHLHRCSAQQVHRSRIYVNAAHWQRAWSQSAVALSLCCCHYVVISRFFYMRIRCARMTKLSSFAYGTSYFTTVSLFCLCSQAALSICHRRRTTTTAKFMWNREALSGQYAFWPRRSNQMTRHR